MPGSTTAGGAWFTLRRRTTIYPPEPPGRPGICAVCRGPARTGYARCYQCAQHDLLGPGLLADAVVPISYAVKGTAFAVSLWRYKSWRSPDPAARTALLTLLLTFLHDHGRCVWRHAGMPAPGRLAVVPTGSGRPGPHPLLDMAGPYLRLPRTGLVIRPGEQGRDPNPDRFIAERPGPGACPAPRRLLGIGRQRPVRGRRPQARGRPPRRGRGPRPPRGPGRPAERPAGRPARSQRLRPGQMRRTPRTRALRK